jgi:ADP-ribose pyrophosphatase YjhB (NUDIX family)
LDLTFSTQKSRFNYRVGAIIIKDGKILVVKNNKSSYYYSVGGRVKFDETCEEAVIREVEEELGLRVEIDRPVFFHEQFFNEQDSNEHFHEISMYYLMKIPENIEKIKCNSFTEKGAKEKLYWLPIEKLADFTVFPKFLTKELSNIPNSLKNIVEIQKR